MVDDFSIESVGRMVRNIKQRANLFKANHFYLPRLTSSLLTHDYLDKVSLLTLNCGLCSLAFDVSLFCRSTTARSTA
jgi:hypothetical protein